MIESGLFVSRMNDHPVFLGPVAHIVAEVLQLPCQDVHVRSIEKSSGVVTNISALSLGSSATSSGRSFA